MKHKDPTFEEVARRESRDCTTCRDFARLWGLEYCNRRKWSGIKNMKRCEEFKWEYRR